MASTVGKIIKCRAAVAWEPKKPLSIEEIEVEPPRAHEVRVRMISTGICHSDASLLNGVLKFSNKFPIILGHEGAGIVESVGEGVTKFKIGDHVIPLYVPQCFECKLCTSTKTNLCEIMERMQPNCCMLDGTSRFKCKGRTLYQFVGTSTFSEYTVVADVCLAKINEKAPLEKVCLIGCAIATGYGAVLNSAKVDSGSTCAVWGLGGIGMAAIMGCRNAGASKIYGIDINPDKFEMAKKFGCTDFINPKDFEGQKLEDVLMEKTNGGFDYTFECIGNIDAMRTAFESSNRLVGMNILIGLASPDKELNISPYAITKGRTLKGTYFGGWKSVEGVPKLVEEYMNKKILVDEFITHTMDLKDINKGFDLMKEGKSIRSVVIF